MYNCNSSCKINTIFLFVLMFIKYLVAFIFLLFAFPLAKFVTDMVLVTGFLSYCGPYN